MTDYFTADLHIGHGTVAHHRGFRTDHFAIPEHDDTIIQNIYATTQPGDTLWILGDVTGGRESDETIALELLSMSLPGRTLRLITGNHDSCHPMRTRSARRQEVFGQAFDTVQSQASLKIAGTRAILNHFCYDGDHVSRDRHEEWRPRDCGMPIIHGHTHASEPVSYSNQGTLQICVSLEAWDLKPVSKDTLTRLIQNELS